MARQSLKLAAGAIAVVLSIGMWNYISVHRPATQSLSDDPRNQGLSVHVTYRWYVNPRVIVFDLRSVSPTNSAADVTRTLLQAASGLKTKEFESVVLAHRGTPKFMLNGSFFRKLGAEYGSQNPVYTLRTLPENVYTLDGRKAFSTWTGGLLGVTGRQMEDLAEFHKQWFVSDL